MNKRAGFTLIELLIVIVVISILASITVVAYNGVTKRAEASAQRALINQWTQQVDIALTLGNTFSPGYSCLGSSTADFPAADGFAAGECWQQDDSGYASNVSYDASDLGSLAQDSASLKGKHAIVERTDSLGSKFKVRGPYIRFFTNSGGQHSLRIRWLPVYAGDCAPGFDEFGSGGICAIHRSY